MQQLAASQTQTCRLSTSVYADHISILKSLSRGGLSIMEMAILSASHSENLGRDFGLRKHLFSSEYTVEPVTMPSVRSAALGLPAYMFR